MKRAAALLALSALTACSMDPHYVRPTPAIPQSFPQGGAYEQQNAAPLPGVS